LDGFYSTNANLKICYWNICLVGIQKEIIKNNELYFYAVMLCSDNMS